jgi:hypothetical protein
MVSTWVCSYVVRSGDDYTSLKTNHLNIIVADDYAFAVAA